MLLLWRCCFCLIVAVAAGSAYAQNSVTPQLQWPLSCGVGRDCFIQSYPDVTAWTDPSHPVDYKCGQRTEPGSVGTKVIFKDWATALADQEVYTVAPGVVKHVVNLFADGEVQTDDKACGNSVVVDHGGWESTYCHLKHDSIKVTVGQKIEAADVLAHVGQSGTATEPLLVFYITRDGLPFDPFLNETIAQAKPCDKKALHGAWNAEVNYVDAANISAGFASRVVNHLEVKANAALPQRELTAHSPYLVSWVRLQHVMVGDEETFTLTSPLGKVVKQRQQKLPGYSADYLSYVTLRADKEGIARGDWMSHYELKRGGRVILQKNNTVHIE